MLAVHVKNAEWLVHIAEHIDNFTKKIDAKGIHAGSMFHHFAQAAQFGAASMCELWVVFEDDKITPIGFAHWQVLGTPHVASVYMGFLHCWKKPGATAKLLIDKFLEYGKRMNAVWYFYDPISERHLGALEHTLKKRGKELKRSQIVHCYHQI